MRSLRLICLRVATEKLYDRLLSFSIKSEVWKKPSLCENNVGFTRKRSTFNAIREAMMLVVEPAQESESIFGYNF